MKDIYGCLTECTSDCNIKDLIPAFKARIADLFSGVTRQLQLAFDTLLVKTVKTTGFLAKMTGTSAASPFMIVYLVWTRMNPGKTFDPEDAFQRNQVKDIYLNMGVDWKDDPVIGIKKSAPTTTAVSVINNVTL